MKRRVPVLVLVLALLATVVPVGLWWVAAGSSASFSDAEVLADNRLGAATVDLEVGQSEAVLSATNLAPGDLVTGHLELANRGTLPIVVSVDAKLRSTDSEALGPWLLFEVWVQSGSCGPADTTERLIEGVSLGATLAPLLPLAPEPRPDLRLAPDETTVLCIGARLPLAAPNSIQGTTADLELVVTGAHDVAATEAGTNPPAESNPTPDPGPTGETPSPLLNQTLREDGP